MSFTRGEFYNRRALQAERFTFGGFQFDQYQFGEFDKFMWKEISSVIDMLVVLNFFTSQKAKKFCFVIFLKFVCKLQGHHPFFVSPFSHCRQIRFRRYYFRPFLFLPFLFFAIFVFRPFLFVVIHFALFRFVEKMWHVIYIILPIISTSK